MVRLEFAQNHRDCSSFIAAHGSAELLCDLTACIVHCTPADGMLLLCCRYWIPCVGAGMVAYFWYDAVRPSESHAWRWYGVACDGLSLAFLAFHIFMFVDIDWPYPLSLVGKMWEEVPEEAHAWDSGLNRYIWSVLSTRLYTPLIAVWVMLASMPGKSLTARVFEWRPLAVTLGPTAYGCFLFHQVVSQW